MICQPVHTFIKCALYKYINYIKQTVNWWCGYWSWFKNKIQVIVEMLSDGWDKQYFGLSAKSTDSFEQWRYN